MWELLRAHRADPVTPVTGGPAGNARLTAWLGLALLAGFVAELVTLLDVRGMVRWHIAIGMALLPPALAKTGTTTWRFARYYTGSRGYRAGGPPPWPLRLLGPLVVLGTLGLLGTGLALVVAGPAASRTHGLFSILTLHKAAFLGWAAVTGLHVLGRALVALDLVRGNRIAGRGGRLAMVALTAAVAVLAVLLTASLVPAWQEHRR